MPVQVTVNRSPLEAANQALDQLRLGEFDGPAALVTPDLEQGEG